jgi:lipid II:glycine glycyltransferase (peptidoglycan interpeptide bridge formation enzyme)
VGYALLWDLIVWSREQTEAKWFDLGGISVATPRDPLAGIVRFKRFFSEHVVEVGQEWRLEPHPVRGAIARAVSTAADVARRSSGGYRRVEQAD